MSTKLIHNDDGTWQFQKKPRKTLPIIKESTLEYLNLLSPIFEAAKKKCEFEFVFTLLRVSGVQGPGWDAYDTTEDLFWKIGNLSGKFKNRTKQYLFLWLYGHILEASEPYQILVNLLQVAKGDRYSVNNFPDEKRGKIKLPVSPWKKIETIVELAQSLGFEANVRPFVEVYDRELRNAIFHSDFTIHEDEIRIESKKRLIKMKDFGAIANRAFSLFIAFSHLIKFYISDYEKPTLLTPHPEFSSPDDKSITMIRDGVGVIGITDVWLPEHISVGKIEHLIGRFTPEESKLHRNDQTIIHFSRSKRDIVNYRLKFFPQFARRYIVKYYLKKWKNAS